MTASLAALRPGQVAREAGINRETLRYYERRGLIPAPQRSPGGHRLYTEEAVTALRTIKAAQRLGFTLEEIAELIEVGTHRHRADHHGLQARGAAKLADLDARIHDLQTMRANLVDALDRGCDDLAECARTDSCPIPFVALATGPEPVSP